MLGRMERPKPNSQGTRSHILQNREAVSCFFPGLFGTSLENGEYLRIPCSDSPIVGLSPFGTILVLWPT